MLLRPKSKGHFLYAKKLAIKILNLKKIVIIIILIIYNSLKKLDER